MSIQSSTADSKNLSGHNSMSASLNTIRCLGEEQIYSYGWRAVTFLCGVVVWEVPDGDPAVGRRAPAGGHPQVPLRQHPRRRHRPLLRRHLPLPLLLLLPPCATHEDTRKPGKDIKSPPNRAESNPSERREPRTIRAERAAGAPVEIGGGGAATGAAEAGADLTPGVAFPPCGGVASGERASQGGGECEGGEGRGGVSPFIYRPHPTL